MILIDIEQWNKKNYTEQAIQFILTNESNLKWADQDALNFVLKNNWYKLNKAYNFCHSYVSIDLPKQEILKNDITIIHYTGSKPWQALNNSRLRSYYYYYLKKSPLSNTKKYIDFTWTKKCLREFIRLRIIEFYLDHASIRNIWRNFKSTGLTNCL